jgi:hypothetical protein
VCRYYLYCNLGREVEDVGKRDVEPFIAHAFMHDDWDFMQDSWSCRMRDRFLRKERHDLKDKNHTCTA